MNLIVDNKVVFDEFQIAVAVLTDECTKDQENEILAGAECLIEVRNFIERVNSGELKPKSMCNKLESILYKYNLT